MGDYTLTLEEVSKRLNKSKKTIYHGRIYQTITRLIRH